MKFYIDSADVTVLKPLMRTGVFHGVTTNPLILRQAALRSAQLHDFADRIFAMGAKEVFFQSWGGDPGSLYEHGRQLSRIDGKVVVKLPVTSEGLEAAARLAGEGIKTCITAVYAPFQAVLAAAVKADFVAPYLGRMNDAGRDGHAMIGQMSAALRETKSPCEILAASVRSPEDVSRLAQNGVRCITVSPVVAEILFKEPLTIQAAESFEAAVRDLQGDS